MENVYQEMEWKALTREQQNDFKRIFLENSNHASSKKQDIDDSVSSEEAGHMITSNFDYNLESERYRLPEYDSMKRLIMEKQNN